MHIVEQMQKNINNSDIDDNNKQAYIFISRAKIYLQWNL